MSLCVKLHRSMLCEVVFGDEGTVVLGTLWGPPCRFHSVLQGGLRQASAGCFPRISVKAAEIRLTGQGGGCDVMRADGCDESTFELRGEGQFSITPSPGSTMEEFLYFGQWKARKE